MNECSNSAHILEAFRGNELGRSFYCESRLCLGTLLHPIAGTIACKRTTYRQRDASGLFDLDEFGHRHLVGMNDARMMLVSVCTFACRTQVVLCVRHGAHVPRDPRAREGAVREGEWSLMCMHAALCLCMCACFPSTGHVMVMAGVRNCIGARGSGTPRANFQVSACVDV